MAKSNKHNGRFSYSGGSKDVYVISFSYSWKLETKGSSIARQAQTVYPFRATASDLNVTLQFKDRKELLSFAKFARSYHKAVTSAAGAVGNGAVPDMKFSLTLPDRTVKSYSVAIPSIPVVQSDSIIAPTMRLTLRVLNDDTNTLKLSRSTSYSFSNMSVTDAIVESNNVTADGVYDDGDDAYVSSSATVSGMGLSTGGH